MIRLEDITRGTIIKGILLRENVTVVDANWHGSDVVELTYKDSQGKLNNQLLFRSDQDSLEIVTDGQPWNFNGKAKVPDTHREQRLFVVTAGENPQLDCLQLVRVCSSINTNNY